MGKKTYAKDYIKNTEILLNNFTKNLEQINQGTFQYDGSMPNSCVDAMYKLKVEKYTKGLAYLKSLEPMTLFTYGHNVMVETGTKENQIFRNIIF